MRQPVRAGVSTRHVDHRTPVSARVKRDWWGVDGVDPPHPMGSPSLTELGTAHSLAVMPTAAFAGDPLAPVFTYADGPRRRCARAARRLAARQRGGRLAPRARAAGARAGRARPRCGADRSARHGGERGRARGRHLRGAVRRPPPRPGRARPPLSGRPPPPARIPLRVGRRARGRRRRDARAPAADRSLPRPAGGAAPRPAPRDRAPGHAPRQRGREPRRPARAARRAARRSWSTASGCRPRSSPGSWPPRPPRSLERRGERATVLKSGRATFPAVHAHANLGAFFDSVPELEAAVAEWLER